jgi:hypothetical protein
MAMAMMAAMVALTVMNPSLGIKKAVGKRLLFYLRCGSGAVWNTGV